MRGKVWGKEHRASVSSLGTPPSPVCSPTQELLHFYTPNLQHPSPPQKLRSSGRKFSQHLIPYLVFLGTSPILKLPWDPP